MAEGIQNVHINADFSERAVTRPDDYQWVNSPMPGVERMTLDRVGDEVARATSLVRYATNARATTRAETYRDLDLPALSR